MSPVALALLWISTSAATGLACSAAVQVWRELKRITGHALDEIAKEL